MTNRLNLTTGLKLLAQEAYKHVHAESIELIKQNVHDPLPYFFLGVIASAHQNHRKALELFSKAVDLGPSIVHYHVYHARTLSTLMRHNAAKESADKAQALPVDDAFLADTLGVVYSRAGYHTTAIPLFEKAVALHASNASFYYNLGASAQFTGDFDTAEHAYKQALALDPNYFRVWPSLVSLKKQTINNNYLDRLRTCFKKTHNDADAQLQLGHAIAKTLEDLDQHPESLTWLVKGKRQKRLQLRYNREQSSELFTAAKTTVDVNSASSEFHAGITPVFVVGLPRTGTTLVDRILSTHSGVISVGELNTFAEIIKEKANSQSNLVMDTQTFRMAITKNLSDVGTKYLNVTADRTQGATCMVDKMPLNFFYASLIHRTLPAARIIVLRRNAIDSCLSNFRQLFSTQYSYYNYTFDLEDTAFFYTLFDNLIAHWRKFLPANRFMEVHYENIVFDQETETRRLLAFCDLPWEDQCLRFHENAAPVSTASSVQVRQPLYTGSIGRWKKYDDKLDSLKAALENMDKNTPA